jgi:hypothetical protein
MKRPKDSAAFAVKAVKDIREVGNVPMARLLVPINFQVVRGPSGSNDVRLSIAV